VIKSIADDIRYQFQSGNTITRLIIVNVVVFLALMLFMLVVRLGAGFSDSTLFNDVVTYLYLSSDPLWSAKHPWTFITHMFTHVGIFHVVFNMLVLYWFGRIAGDLLGDHRMLPLYIFSGLAGALIYMLTAPLVHPSGSTLNGASGAIFGIVAAAGMTAPDYQMRLLLFGDVRLKYIVFALLAISFIGIGMMDNTGGNMAHLGGAAFGFFYVHMLRRGHDLTNGFRKALNIFKKRKPKPYVAVKRKVTLEVRHKAGSQQADTTPRTTPSMGDQERLDYILEKIKRAGMHSLSEEEKKFLNDASQK
jgi:membrane associated rhomboid family serine protease